MHPATLQTLGLASSDFANSVVALGNSFEVVSPTQPDTAAGRMLTRQNGDCGYMVLLQANDIKPVSSVLRRCESVKSGRRSDRSECLPPSPKDVGGASVSIDQMRPPESWLWAGPDWHANRSRRGGALQSISIEVEDADVAAGRWSQLLDVPCRTDGDFPVLDLEDGQTIRFLSESRISPRGLCTTEWRWLGGVETMPAPQKFCGVELAFTRDD